MWNSWSNEETSRLDIVSLWLVTACEFPMQSLWPLNKPLRYLFDFSSCLFVLVFADMPACPLAINSPCLHGSTSFHHHSSHGSHFRSLQGLNLFIWVVLGGFFFNSCDLYTEKQLQREEQSMLPDLPSPGMKVFRNRQMTARGKGIVGIAARRGPFFSLTSTTTPPPADGAPDMALAPRLSPVFTHPCSDPPSFCAISLSFFASVWFMF